MIKRTLFFGAAGELTLRAKQLVWMGRNGQEQTRPIEDIGFLILESSQIRISTALLMALVENGVSVILCDARHTPSASMIPFDGNTLTNKCLKIQIEASEAKRGRLWKQLVVAKILNQAACVALFDPEGAKPIAAHAKNVANGDPDNQEAQAAYAYFGWFSKNLCAHFKRDSEGDAPNHALNYGYAILRAAVARALVSSGLSCSIGLHHCNQYNAFGLADDVMEPYRPFIDQLVFSNLSLFMENGETLSTQAKSVLLLALEMDVVMEDTKRPLMIAISQTTASLVRALEGNADTKLKLPSLS